MKNKHWISVMSLSVDELIREYYAESGRYSRNWGVNGIFELSRKNDPRIPDIIIEALNDDDPIRRHYAAVSLTIRKTEIPQDIFQSETSRYIPILIKLVEDGNEVLPTSMDICGVCRALSKLGGLDTIDILIHAMASESRIIRQGARVGLIGLLFDDEGSLAYVIQALKNGSRYIRAGTSWVLSIWREEFRAIVIDHLIEGLQFPEFRYDFVVWLGDVGDLKAVPALIPLLGDNTELLGIFRGGTRVCVKHYTGEALRKIGEDSVPFLRDALSHDNEEVRTMLVYTLYQIATPSAQTIIQSLENHSDKTLRDAVQNVNDGHVFSNWLENLIAID